LFEDYTKNVITEDKGLPNEESVMTLMYYNHKELFERKHFDIWWHEDERVAGTDMAEHTRINKSFYKILEEINRTYE
jgi:hypothetical protein